jgi:hypothetical protein
MKSLSLKNDVELVIAQRRVYELRQIGNKDREFKAAQAEIQQLVSLQYWREPKLIEVRNISDHSVPGIDQEKGTRAAIPAGFTGTIYDFDLLAMRRWLEPVNPKPEPEMEAARPAPINTTDLVSTKEIKLLLVEIAKGDKEAAELERMANAARADLTLVAASNMPLEAAKKKISEANMTLDFVAARADKINAPAKLISEKLSAELLQQVRIWNSIVVGISVAIEEAVIQANLPYFNGDEGECRRLFNGGIMAILPVFTSINEAIYDDLGLKRLEGSKLTARAKDFTRHVEKYCSKLKISPEIMG